MSSVLRMRIPFADNPLTPNFWFVMSLGLLVGFIFAYPMNWWLVANHLKHGMMTLSSTGSTPAAKRPLIKCVPFTISGTPICCGGSIDIYSIARERSNLERLSFKRDGASSYGRC